MNKRDGGNRRFILIEMEEKIATDVTAQRLRRVIEGHLAPGESPGAGSSVGVESAGKTRGNGGNIPGNAPGESPGAKSGAKSLEALGGGFRYCTLGEPLFNADGTIREQVKYKDLAHHIFFTETGRPWSPRTDRKSGVGKTPGDSSGAKWGPYLGCDGGRSIYLLFNGILGDKSAGGGNVLTRATLETCALPKNAAGIAPGSAPGDSPGAKWGRVIYGEGCRLSAGTLKRLGVTFKQLPYDVKIT